MEELQMELSERHHGSLGDPEAPDEEQSGEDEPSHQFNCQKLILIDGYIVCFLFYVTTISIISF